MSHHIHSVVIGAGVVGLAVARQLALAGHETIILEREKMIGSGISARNSEVIHAGLYYPKDSLKARTCVAGRKLLYDYCHDHHVPHKQCGKLVVATDDSQLPQLEALYQAGVANGVEGLELLSRRDLAAREPSVSGHGALWCPVSGIVDSHALMLSLQGDFEGAGGVIAFQTMPERITIREGLFHIHSADGTVITATHLVNCAGLGAQEVAATIEGLAPSAIPPRYLAKGNYFTLARRAPFTHLVYPLPEPGGLGVHVTLDMAGQARFGPDVQWIDAENYAVDISRIPHFYQAIRRYWPDIREDDLQPGYVGIRPKITPPGAPAADFVIQDSTAHGIKGLINLYGIESPGLTASLSLAKSVEKALYS